MSKSALRKWVAVGTFVGSAFVAGRGFHGFSDGIASYSGAIEGEDCNACHSGGREPTVTITGPTEVAPGTTVTYELRIVQPILPNNAGGGLDVSASEGALSVADPGTQLLGVEITHTEPRASIAGQVAWTFNWTAPVTPGIVTLYGAGNAVNFGNGYNRDMGATASLDIAVGTAATPGESSGTTLSPLLVTAFDALTGEMTLAFETACETTSNNLYFGPLDQVGAYGWSGAVCDIGTSGAHAGFDPGAGSFFFVVVGTKATSEGSYGRSLDSGGGSTERPPYAGNGCGQAQNLSQACD